MAKTVNWRDVLSPDLVDEIDAVINRQFVDGWRACQRAMSALEPTQSMASSLRDEDGARQYPPDRAPKGLWSGLLEQEARERFPRELPLNEAMSAVQARTDKFNLARSSLNAAITSLEDKGKLRRDGKKLLWAQPAEDRDEQRPWDNSDEEAPKEAVSPIVRKRLSDNAT